ncbi:DUF2586 domain-containing protein [Shewanella sp. D64]|uniref:DUF2586 domain-containing protein n=1 Tax=unclassified Shewanella TaxID=196818 RepID=UPI0022BA2191|nr:MULTISPECIES: DUF2586 domain-containing protein [unclassified Shewanella]MEC4725850.1 DUF2586 domain-containing protein [Shewanella sp. D64]MEC4737105.1 DUF2586 domain-containing protein [Shewanella sp. E94]WBJ93561.1 DUF2586 domain-containing protein [Shewanella sp. MTB7]WBJ95703.1 DUF2586 domain-containing protein [Shewanella sp. MTB7]
MYPTINVSLLNQGQGESNEIERHFLFIGAANITNKGSLIAINAQTDINTLFTTDSPLKTTVTAAQLNGGQNWTAAIWALAENQTFSQATLAAQLTGSFEAIVVCDPITTADDISAANTLHIQLVSTWARWTFIMLQTRSLLSTAAAKSKAAVASETWAQYLAIMAALQTGIKAQAVMLVPPTHTNNLGVLAGRLCNRNVTIADSPMRVKTGALVGLGQAVLDSTNSEIDSATLQALETNRFNVIATFPDYAGTYWADGRTLDAEGGDLQVIEYLRPLMKAARRVRLLAIPRIADRSLNNSASSTAAAKSYFAKPLRDMSKGIKIGDTPFEGEIRPPESDAIGLTWQSNSTLSLFIKVQPWNSPKAIDIGVMLDLSDTGATA